MTASALLSPTPVSSAHGGYRADIDGLRAFAVGAVVLFHAGIPQLSGGYVGVDVFFVISGYLITQTLLRDHSIVRFYQRRARRILPALFAMLLIVLGVGAALLLPHDLEEVAKSAGATVLFVSNIFFWRGAGYFAVETELWPLLHTWSLGVEEQFYLAFPLLVGLMARLRWKRHALVFVVLALASFALAEYGLAARKTTVVFYHSPTRAWELLVGSILATGALPALHRPVARAIAAVIGLACIVAPVFAYLPSTHFPGAGALPPVLGTALLIWSGEAGSHPLTPLLQWEPLRGIGLISYSLYLWHWPILAYARYVAIDPLSPAWTTVAVAGSLLAAWLSWRFVERPFRTGVSNRAIWLLSLSGIVAILALSIMLVAAHGLPGRVPAAVRALNAAQGTTWRCPVTAMRPLGRYYACPLNFDDGRLDRAEIVLWGDSHAQMYAPALVRSAGAHRALLVIAHGCAPVAGDGPSAACGAIQRGNFAEIARLSAKTVILAQNWPQARDEVGKRTGRPTSSAERYREGVRRLRALVTALRRAGKRVVIVAPIAIPSYEVSSVVSRSLWFYGKATTPLGVTRADHLREYANVLTAMDELARDPDVMVLRTDAGSCDGRACRYVIGGSPIFSDRGHYTESYVQTLAPIFARAVDFATAPSHGRNFDAAVAR